MKTCKICEKDLPDTEFTVVSYASITGKRYLDSHCRPCRYATRKAVRQAGSKTCPQCNITHLVTQHYKGDPMCMQCRDDKKAGKQSKRVRIEPYEIHSKTPPPNLAHRNILWDEDLVKSPPYVIPKIPDILTNPIQAMLSGTWA